MRMKTVPAVWRRSGGPLQPALVWFNSCLYLHSHLTQMEVVILPKMDSHGTGLIIPSNQHLFSVFNGASNVQKTLRHFVRMTVSGIHFPVPVVSECEMNICPRGAFGFPHWLLSSFTHSTSGVRRTYIILFWMARRHEPDDLLLPNKWHNDSIWSSFRASSHFESWKGPSQDSLDLFTNQVDDETW